jgi:hypothetical protein
MSTTRPAPARITDYRDPSFSPDVRAIRDAVAQAAETVHLDAEALIAEASSQLGLDDFGGDGSWRERLDVLCGALRDEAGLSAFGRVSNATMLAGLLKNRLLLTRLLNDHPEIHDVPITAPIVICGLPRTGTTHLHNLISADSRLRSLPYWESLEPIPNPAESPDSAESPPGASGEDPRITRCRLACDFLDASMPLFKRMHEMTWDHVHEEIQLLAIDMSTMLFESSAYVPSWRRYYEAHDQRPHYAYLKTVLQAITWLRGGERWVLKSPQHLEQFPALVETFPDATFVVTHRDPVSVTISMVTMLAYTARMNAARPDPTAIAAEWAGRLEVMLRACAHDRDALPDERTVDVRFDEFMADDIAMVQRIYDVAAQPFTDETRAEMSAFVNAHPRGRHGGIIYDFADFGLDPGERYRALDFYLRRFGLTPER